MKKLREKVTTFLAQFGKRQRFIVSTLILTGCIFISSLLTFEVAQYFFIILVLVGYIVTFIAIPNGINKTERLMLFLLPVLFSVAIDLFFFFLPGRWLTRVPFITLSAISIYAILLSSNILNVGTEKNLKLFNAAFSINFLFLTLTSFLAYNVILSFKLNFFFNFFLFFISTFPLALQFLWSINPRPRVEKEIMRYALFISYIIAQTGTLLSFSPIQSTIFSLFLTAAFYSLNGLFYAYVEERLFKDRIREFIFVLIFVFLVIILSLRWTG